MKQKNSHARFGVCALGIYLPMFLVYARELAVYACIWKYKYLYIFNKKRIDPRHLVLGWLRLEVLLLFPISFKFDHGFLFFPSYPKLMTEYFHWYSCVIFFHYLVQAISRKQVVPWILSLILHLHQLYLPINSMNDAQSTRFIVLEPLKTVSVPV